ncbi:hypothetical protein [Sulfoacidibacillus ferrooxidans]|uniref:Uncharacterized protein n=1 Tax=Sulfoacidibacillus ferrooxidans TaxID=2005001 RepID=A0A9X1VB69_9BACL|nr:hypothetical protein [Sulfoacidibacillus ferrooxidans]MCI0183418.1 hypothetical protein [Sulfoacidibacillus ferrooxidans]
MQLKFDGGQDKFTSVPIGVLVGSLFAIDWGYRLWGSGLVYPATTWLSVILIGFGLVSLLLAFAFPLMEKKLEFISLLASCIGFAWWVYTQIHLSPGYQTDEIAFDQYASHLLLQGINPYAHSLALAFRRYLVPPTYYTYLLSGQPVVSLSYPALSFLLYTPVMALGVHMHAALYVDAFFWMGSSVLLWFLLPSQIRWIAFLVLGFMMFDGNVFGGVTDALFMPFLILAVWKWDRFVDPTHPLLLKWMGPIMLGLAMSVKQTAWFLAPFLVLGIMMESKRSGQSWWRNPLRYIVGVAVPFLLVNVPFIVWDPIAWIQGSLLPLVSSTVPQGQGIVGLWLYDHVGNGHMEYLKLLGAFVLVLEMLLFVTYYSRFKRSWILFIPLALFWTERSLFEYLVDLLPILLVAAISVRTIIQDKVSRIPRLSKYGIGIFSSASLLVFCLSFIGGQPLKLQVTGVQTTGELGLIDSVSVHVINHENTPVSPHFTVMENTGQLPTFWLSSGPSTLLPKQAADYTLSAPNVPAMPSITNNLSVDAFTTTPATISTSADFYLPKMVTVLSPRAFNTPVKIGVPFSLTVQLRSTSGIPLHLSGVPVTLNQVMYGPNYVSTASSTINGSQAGAMAVTSITNASGQAVFTVQGQFVEPLPTFFEADIPNSGQPFGYSNIASINFVK